MKVFIGVGDNRTDLRDLARELLGLININEVRDNIEMPSDEGYMSNTSMESVFNSIDECDMFFGIVPKSKHKQQKILQQISYCYGTRKPYCLLVERGAEPDLSSESRDSYKSCQTLEYNKMTAQDIVSILRFLNAFKKTDVKEKRCIQDTRSHLRLLVDVEHDIIDESLTVLSVKYRIQSLTDNFSILIYHNELSELSDGESKQPIPYFFQLKEQPQIIAENSERKIYVNAEKIVKNPFKLQIPIIFDPPLVKGEIAEFTLTMKMVNYRPYSYADLEKSRLSTFSELGRGCIATWQVIEPTRKLALAFKFPKDYEIENPSYHVYSNRGIIAQQEIKYSLKEPESFQRDKENNRLSLTVMNPTMNYQYLVFYAPKA